MDPPTFISQSYRDSPILTEVEVVAIVMVVRGDPAHPHTGWVLSSKNSHRMVVLKKQKASVGPTHETQHTLQLCLVSMGQKLKP